MLHNYLLTLKQQSVNRWFLILITILIINEIFSNSTTTLGTIVGWSTGIAAPFIFINIFVIAYKNKELQISNWVKNFLLILSSISLVLLFWLIFSLYTNFVDPAMLGLLGLFIFALLGYAWFKLYKKSPALVVKLSLSIIFTILIGYFWYQAWRWESGIINDEFGWYKFPVESRLDILRGYLAALFNIIAVSCVASFVLRCFKIGNKI